CRDAAKSLRECTIARRELVKNYFDTENARLNLLAEYNALAIKHEHLQCDVRDFVAAAGKLGLVVR
ncbi:MAG: hypothetical protein V3S12_01240, partial [Acidiferrobacterales bacterium]